MIKVLLIDDEKKSTLTLKKLLNRYCTDFVVQGEADNIRDALGLIKEKDPDVVFLDIEMADGTGFDLLKRFDDPFFRIVFVTAHSRYAVKAFKFSAIDYLLKPVDIDDLKRAADKIRNSVRDGLLLKGKQLGRGEMLQLRAKKDHLTVSTNHIIRIKALGSYSRITLLNGEEHLVSAHLGALEEKIDDKMFLRIHRSEIININHIVRIIKKDALYAELPGGIKVEISRRNRATLFAVLKEKQSE
ncbi:MAG TPA: LytTR family DNA-binding domain-containing protein [Chitinophagaceae bacterium]|nr:LytTR family DNA-binding domain-containing protein [Chitinophagaceae bacterium]